MAASDDNYIDPSNVSLWPTALRYGGIAGALIIAMSLIMHLSGMIDYSNQGGSAAWISTLFKYGIWIAAIVMAIKFHRTNELGGYISFGRAFGVGFGISLIIGILGGLFSFLFFSFIAPEAIEIMRDAAVENMSEDQAEAASGMMGAMMSPVAMIIYSVLEGLLGGGIVSLIAAAVMKREASHA